MISMLKDSNFLRNKHKNEKKVLFNSFLAFFFLYVAEKSYFCRCFEVSVLKL